MEYDSVHREPSRQTSREASMGEAGGSDEIPEVSMRKRHLGIEREGRAVRIAAEKAQKGKSKSNGSPFAISSSGPSKRHLAASRSSPEHGLEMRDHNPRGSNFGPSRPVSRPGQQPQLTELWRPPTLKNAVQEMYNAPDKGEPQPGPSRQRRVPLPPSSPPAEVAIIPSSALPPLRPKVNHERRERSKADEVAQNGGKTSRESRKPTPTYLSLSSGEENQPPLRTRSGSFASHTPHNGNSSPGGRASMTNHSNHPNHRGHPANGHTQSSPTKRTGFSSRIPSRLLVSDTDEEEEELVEDPPEPEEPIEQFTPTPDKSDIPGQSKGKGAGTVENPLAAAASSSSSFLAPSAHRKKKPMQKKDGTIASSGLASQVPRSKRMLIPSSNINNPVLAAVDFCFIVDQESSLNYKAQLSAVSLNATKCHLELHRNGDGHRPSSIASIPIECVEEIGLSMSLDDYPFCRLQTNLWTGELQGLYNVVDAGRRTTFANEALIHLHLSREPASAPLLRRLLELFKEHLVKEGVDEKNVTNKITYFDPNAIATFRAVHDDPEHFRDNDGPTGIPRQERSGAASRAARAAHFRSALSSNGGRSRTNADAIQSKGKGKEKEREQDGRQSKLTFGTERNSTTPMSRPRRSTRFSEAPHPSQYVEEEPDDSDITALPPPRRKSPRLDKHDLLFPYPPEGRVDVNITKGERYRLTDGDFLNDVFLEFGLRYTLNEAVMLNSDVHVHMFNSFFYERLAKKDKTKASDDHWPAYDTVKKWTKSANVFEKEFLIVPINESFHWFLAVIYNPKGILKPKAKAVEADDLTNRPVTRAAAATFGEDVTSTKDGAAPSNTTSPKDNALPNDGISTKDEIIESSRSCSTTPTVHMSSRSPEVEEAQDGDNSKDPLDVMSEGGDDDAIELDPPAAPSDTEVRMGVERLSLSQEQRMAERELLDPSPREISPPRSPQPICSIDLQMIVNQDNPAALAQLESERVPPPKAEVVATPKAPELVDRQIWKSDETWIMTFDSLGSPHKAVGNTLRRWLEFEARDKLSIPHEMTAAHYVDVKVPQQPNFSDCGVFLIHYVHMLLKNPEDTLGFAGKVPPKPSAPERQAWAIERDRVWKQQQTAQLRADWTFTIDDLTAKYMSKQEALGAASKESVSEVPGSQASVVLTSPVKGSPPPPALDDLDTADEPPSIADISQHHLSKMSPPRPKHHAQPLAVLSESESEEEPATVEGSVPEPVTELARGIPVDVLNDPLARAEARTFSEGNCNSDSDVAIDIDDKIEESKKAVQNEDREKTKPHLKRGIPSTFQVTTRHELRTQQKHRASSPPPKQASSPRPQPSSEPVGLSAPIPPSPFAGLGRNDSPSHPTAPVRREKGRNSLGKMQQHPRYKAPATVEPPSPSSPRSTSLPESSCHSSLSGDSKGEPDHTNVGPTHVQRTIAEDVASSRQDEVDPVSVSNSHSDNEQGKRGKRPMTPTRQHADTSNTSLNDLFSSPPGRGVKSAPQSPSKSHSQRSPRVTRTKARSIDDTNDDADDEYVPSTSSVKKKSMARKSTGNHPPTAHKTSLRGPKPEAPKAGSSSRTDSKTYISRVKRPAGAHDDAPKDKKVKRQGDGWRSAGDQKNEGSTYENAISLDSD